MKNKTKPALSCSLDSMLAAVQKREGVDATSEHRQDTIVLSSHSEMWDGKQMRSVISHCLDPYTAKILLRIYAWFEYEMLLRRKLSDEFMRRISKDQRKEYNQEAKELLAKEIKP